MKNKKLLEFEFSTRKGRAIQYMVSYEQSLRIITAVFGWDAGVVLRKPLKSIQFWLNRASKSDKLTLERMMFIQNYILDEKYTNRLPKFIRKLFR